MAAPRRVPVLIALLLFGGIAACGDFISTFGGDDGDVPPATPGPGSAVADASAAEGSVSVSGVVEGGASSGVDGGVLPSERTDLFVFVTDNLFFAQLVAGPDRLSPADELCTKEATSAGLGDGRFRAWLAASADKLLPRYRIRPGSGAYLALDRTRVAESFDALMDGKTIAPINITPSGVVVSKGTEVWTGFELGKFGVPVASASTCEDWTSTAAKGTFGIVCSGPCPTEWFASGLGKCGEGRRLFCVEEPSPDKRP